jgi:cysteine synthase B
VNSFFATEELARAPRRRDTLLELIGHTPLVRLRHVTAGLPDGVEVWGKLEFLNPGGSVKDRPARQIMTSALERGDLKGKTLIDATSGNTGIAYAMLGAALGVPVALVMPENVSDARKRIIGTYGAKIVYSSPLEGSDGAIRMVREIVAEHPDTYYYANQYANPDNPLAHQRTTAPEIWEQTDGRVTHFIAATGTSGTIMGTSRGLKAKNPDIQCHGCQPDDSFHGLEGLKHMATSIVPPIYGEDELDGVRWLETEAGWEMAERLAAEEGIPAGNSAGANVVAALDLAREIEKGVIVTIICDNADRYLGE